MKGKAFIGIFIWTFVLWLMLTASLNVWELIAGALISLFASFAGAGMLADTKWVDILVNPAKWFAFLFYLVVLWVEIVKASIDVWMRAMGLKKPNIRAGVVKIQVPNESVESMVMLANSITLTPGTITAKINPEDKTLYIHWIAMGDKDKWYEDIASSLNRGVRRVLP